MAFQEKTGTQLISEQRTNGGFRIEKHGGYQDAARSQVSGRIYMGALKLMFQRASESGSKPRIFITAKACGAVTKAIKDLPA